MKDTVKELVMSCGENFVVKYDNLLKYLGIFVETASREFARVTMPLHEHHRNGMGAAHGGVICALADAAFGAAANSDSEFAVVTVSSHIDFLRPSLVGPMLAEAKATHLGSRILNYDVKVLDGKGLLVARGMLTGFITHMRLDDARREREG